MAVIMAMGGTIFWVYLITKKNSRDISAYGCCGMVQIREKVILLITIRG